MATLRARFLAGLLLAGCCACAAQVRWQPPVEVARGGGERGPWRQSASRYDFVDDGSVAWSPAGELAVAWVDQRRKAVLLQRYSAAGKPLFGAPVDVSRLPGTFSWLPRLAWAPDDPGRLHVLWQEIIFSGGSHGGEILLASSTDGGRSFAPVLNLSRSRGGDGKGRITPGTWHNGSLDIAVAPRGRVYAAWTDYEGNLWFVRSEDRGRSFSRPLRVARDSPARAPALAVGSDGTVLLAWTSGDIRIARSADGGRSFAVAHGVAVTPAWSDAPKLAFDGAGVLHLVHAEGGAIVHRRSGDGGRSFGPPRELAAEAAYPALGIDGRGRVVVSWEAMRGPLPYGLGMAVAEDGIRFGVPQPVPGSTDPGGGFNGSTQGLLMKKLAVRADGAIAVVNSAVKIGSHSRVWLLRGSLP